MAPRARAHTLCRGTSDYKQIKTGGPHQTASNTHEALWGAVGVCVRVCQWQD